MDSAQPNSSSLSINFGERHQPGTPFDLSFILDFFSQEVQIIPFSNKTSEILSHKNTVFKYLPRVSPSNLLFKPELLRLQPSD